MMRDNAYGFREVPHTADWALEVWAPDLPGLLIQAARGMYWLMETTLQEGPHVKRALELEGPDHETLLVTFLSELLYIGEMEGQGFDLFEVSIEATRLSASLHGAPIAAQRKEIKAVTYHNLAIRPAPSGLQVTIVFDV